MSSYVIKNAKVFDGEKFVGVKDVAVKDGKIVDQAPEDATVVDGNGKTLLPGLWDCHIHIYDRPEFLEDEIKNGVTSVCDMGCRNRETVDKMKDLDIVHILSSYSIICAPTSGAVENMKYPERIRVKNAEEATALVDKYVSWGADYVKIVIEEQTGAGEKGGAPFPVEIGKAIVEEAHKNGKKVIAHAIDFPSFKKATEIGVDIITHMPLSGEMPDEVVDKVAEQGETLLPTITMMTGVAEMIKARNPKAPIGKEVSENNLKKFLNRGVKAFISTDSNIDDETTPSDVYYGTSVHEEILNFAECGLSNEEVLADATSRPAEYFGQTDRGEIADGKTADLLLVDGDLENDLSAIRNVSAVWYKGEKKIG